uniref:Uncharacterized protein n=1 Tax=Pseudoalteromonas rubra TaxID=43658 RepID=A0A0F4QIP9_9GAMM|nr:hypothetical protein TW77_14875 [Pseudoalteromonas rubra]
MHKIAIRHLTPVTPVPIGKLKINHDPYASKIMVINRQTGELIFSTKPSGATTTRLLPLTFTTSSELLVLMLDNTKVYNAAIVDHVQAQVVDFLTHDSTS